MCGVVAVAGMENAVEILLSGLSALEYRGYDSAGIALVDDGDVRVVRRAGKVSELSASAAGLAGSVGIAHTRWATHGAATEVNAHPHRTAGLALAHNGVIENFAELKADLSNRGYAFESHTDTEALAVLIQSFLDAGKAPREALDAALMQARGTYALAIIFTGEPDAIYGAKLGSPLAIGTNGRAHFLGSDALALSGVCDKILYMLDGERCAIRAGAFEIWTAAGALVKREFEPIAEESIASREGFAHFMQKEIAEQPEVISRAWGYISGVAHDLNLDCARRIYIVACGTSYHAALVSKYWIEAHRAISVEVEFASEFRYRRPRLQSDDTAIFLSQSGETADTLAALRYAKEQGARTVAIVNVESSTMAREAETALYIKAGPEIGVASTKAFAAVLVVLAKLAGATDLSGLSALAMQVLAMEERVRDIAASLVVGARDAMFIGRGTMYPTCLEAALKLKEISYIHADGYAAGELKHGPIALVEPGYPVIVMAGSDATLFDKTISNMFEAKARGAAAILVAPSVLCEKMSGDVDAFVPMPEADEFAEPILYAIVAQMLAYHTAVLMGRDVDQPRNLAKSVTVE